jgi:hypothetical protein
VARVSAGNSPKRRLAALRLKFSERGIELITVLAEFFELTPQCRCALLILRARLGRLGVRQTVGGGPQCRIEASEFTGVLGDSRVNATGGFVSGDRKMLPEDGRYQEHGNSAGP